MAIDFRLRDYFHPISLFTLRRELERNQWLSAEELRDDQARRLGTILRHAQRQIPYYRELFDRCSFRPEARQNPEQLQVLPLLTRQDLQERGAELTAGHPRKYGSRWYSTSGTSSTPVRFLLDRQAHALEFCYYWRHWSWAGYKLGDRFAELGTTHFLNSKRNSDTLIEWQPWVRRLMLNAARISPSTASQVLSSFRLRRPRFLKGMASALQQLAQCLLDGGFEGWPFQAVFSTGEVLTPSCRAQLQRVFQGPVLDSYGHMERTVAIAQCERGGYHLNSDYGLLELVDRRPSTDGDGEVGRVVGTGLHNLVMPLVRYDLGDEIQTVGSEEDCPCGRTLPLIRAIHGRVEDMICTPDGRRIGTLYCIVEPWDSIRAFQFHQEAPDFVRMLVVPDEGWENSIKEDLLLRGHRLLGRGMKMKITEADEQDLVRPATGKFRVVSGRPNGGLPTGTSIVHSGE